MASDPSAVLVLQSDAGGAVLIPSKTPLSRLNYFDGKFLRASDLELEQKYLRDLVAISNQGLGPGVVYGFDTTLSGGDGLQLGPGLAVDPAGNVLYLPQAAELSIQQIIDASKATSSSSRKDDTGKQGTDAFIECVDVAAPPAVEALPESNLWVIAICRAEAFCGQEDVFGKLCEEACVTTTDRPIRTEGVVVRAIPLQLVTPFPTSRAVAIDGAMYLESKVAHSYFADEVLKHPRALSRSGLLSTTWCLGAGYDSGCCEVPLAVVARSGSTTRWLDAWIVRRERMDAPARRYWQWKLRMRPWDTFMAQVLQFQCQLAHVLGGDATGGEADPCADANDALSYVAEFMTTLRARAVEGRDTFKLLGLSFSRMGEVRERIDAALRAAANRVTPVDRLLIRGGIIELPPAGYLPVLTGTSQSVNDQVRALLGEGLDYRFCVTTADYPAHALEEAQHMDRLSLLQGLDDPTHKPKVDILVPEGKITSSTTTPDAAVYEALLRASTEQTGGLVYKGAAREEALDTGGTALFAAGTGISENALSRVATIAEARQKGTDAQAAEAPEAAAATTTFKANLDSNPFAAQDPTTSPTFFAQVMEAASKARTRTYAARKAGFAVPISETNLAFDPKRGTVDGFWLDATTTKRIRDLPRDGQTELHGRIIAARLSSTALSLEARFKGVMTVTEVRPATSTTPLTLRAIFKPVVTLDVGYDQPTREMEIGMSMTRRLNLELEFTFEGSGTLVKQTVDVFDVDDNHPERPAFRLRRATALDGNDVLYSVFATADDPNNPGGVIYTPVARMPLNFEVEVVREENVYHRLAEEGLDIVQGTRLQTEPEFKETYEPHLFPPLPDATTELIIQPTLDWVMFTKRRELQCTAVFEQPQVLPSRTYRIFNLRFATAAEAAQIIDALKDPVQLAREVQVRSKEPPFLVVKFEGGTARPLFDFADVAQDWQQFSPGEDIVHVFYGEAAGTDSGLEASRLTQFEQAIGDISHEQAGTSVRTAFLPLPEDARPADADGVMFFITVATQLTCEEVIEFPLRSAITHVGPDFTYWNRLKEVLGTVDSNTGALPEILRLLASEQATNAGKVRFTEGTDQIVDGATTIKSDLQTRQRRVLDMALWDSALDTQAATRLPEAVAIRTALGDRASPDLQPAEARTRTEPKVSINNAVTTCPALVFMATYFDTGQIPIAAPDRVKVAEGKPAAGKAKTPTRKGGKG